MGCARPGSARRRETVLRLAEHGSPVLGRDKPGFFALLGEGGLVGPRAGPGKGLDGHLMLTFGVQGFW